MDPVAVTVSEELSLQSGARDKFTDFTDVPSKAKAKGLGPAPGDKYHLQVWFETKILSLTTKGWLPPCPLRPKGSIGGRDTPASDTTLHRLHRAGLRLSRPCTVDPPPWVCHKGHVTAQLQLLPQKPGGRDKNVVNPAEDALGAAWT